MIAQQPRVIFSLLQHPGHIRSSQSCKLTFASGVDGGGGEDTHVIFIKSCIICKYSAAMENTSMAGVATDGAGGASRCKALNFTGSNYFLVQSEHLIARWVRT